MEQAGKIGLKKMQLQLEVNLYIWERKQHKDKKKKNVRPRHIDSLPNLWKEYTLIQKPFLCKPTEMMTISLGIFWGLSILNTGTICVCDLKEMFSKQLCDSEMAWKLCCGCHVIITQHAQASATCIACSTAIYQVFPSLILFCRDISFLCDATIAQKKTTLLPPLTDRSSVGDTQVSCLCSAFSVM